MTRYVDVSHAEWIDAPVATVRAQFADLDHQIRRNVHQSLRLRMLEQRPRGARFVQEMRLLGIRQRNVFERTIEPDGTIEDVSVEGFNRGATLRFDFEPAWRGQRLGTLANVAVRLPLPPVVGALVKPLLETQLRRQLCVAAQENKADIEARGYPARSDAAAGSAAHA